MTTESVFLMYGRLRTPFTASTASVVVVVGDWVADLDHAYEQSTQTLPPEEAFLSHSSEDQLFVNKLVHVLQRHGIVVWYSETNIQGAQQWHDEIGAALRRCDWFILVLSPHAVGSTWVKRELVYALQQDRYEGRILPLVYRSCSHDDLSWTLSPIQMVDFTNDFDDGCRAMLATWDIRYVPELLSQ